MTGKQINIKQLEGKTVGEILKLESQAPNLPAGFKFKLPKLKIKSAQELIDELE